jgi:hypothetical protein
MPIEDLMRSLIGYVNAHHGSFYTSTNLRDNPDVCHACCIWFLTNVARDGIQPTLARLASLSKSTFRVTQQHVLGGSAQPSRMLRQARGSGRGVSDGDVDAIEYAIAYHQQPTAYIGDIVTFVANVVVAMRTAPQDGMIIYMRGSGGGAGHVICLRRNVGGILIYDPNMGVMTARLAETDTWSEILRRTLRWYRENMDLQQFGYMFK